MRVVNVTMSVAALCAGIALCSFPAAAEETGSLSSCAKLGHQVDQALASHAQSPNYQAAVKQEHYGRDFCLNSLYGHGVAHYEEALKLLGATGS